MRGRPRNPRVAFALVLTLVLMAFAVALLLVFAALARIEGVISEQSLLEAQARQNARMALSIALGQLQKFAGPDARVTATAESFTGVHGSSHCTGVWDASANPVVPLAWLVSGSERGSAALPLGGESSAELLGLATSGIAGDVLAPLQEITGEVMPSFPAGKTIGHYAWWVGDEGGKASVALADRTPEIDYAPFDSAELRSRLRQQRALGAGPVDSAGAVIFEPRTLANTGIVDSFLQFNQLAQLRNVDGLPAIAPAALGNYFHAWTTQDSGVLANPKLGGLRQDLSLNPGLLGTAFAAWADSAGYVENPLSPSTPAISPAYSAEPLRRRLRMTAPQSASGVTQGISPKLSYFLLTFNIRTDQSVSGSVRPLEVRARWLATFWNPCASALVPENLQLEVSGLPSVTVVNDTAGTTLSPLDLGTLYGAPLRISLPWITAGREDQASWFPGRVYTWSAQEDLDKSGAVPSAGFASVFYTRTMSTTAGQGVQRAAPALSLSNSAQAHLQGPSAQLSLRLYRVLSGGGRELLGTALSPSFNGFSTTPAAISAATYQFTYVFSLAESIDTPATPDVWLSSAGQDFREPTISSACYLPGANGPRPELYPNYTTVSFPDRLLDRALPASAASSTGQSYNEDVPLFDLPRGPLLSIGELQHLPLAGSRPFSVGNSWGDAGGRNAVFDQFYFSGLGSPVDATLIKDGAPLPNPLLSLEGRAIGGAKLTYAEVVAGSPTGFSSRFLRQSGAFNINSVNPLAWAAVLRSGRFVGGNEFRFLDAKAATGTSADVTATAAGFGDAVFFRFPFSAQETFKAFPGFAAGTGEPPASPSTPSLANTHLFRRGVRTLSPDQTSALANAIADRVRQKLSSSGPFRSVEEFLAPFAIYAGKNALESAIAGATGADGKSLNDPSGIPEFSSHWLTSGDIMTTLAPLLFARSDTFLIRAYGDVVNPFTGVREARAWLEARVQRTAEFADASQSAETNPAALNPCNKTYGRRFRIVSFRWLDRSDI